MKVTIEHQDVSKGLVFKENLVEVTVAVEFTDEEEAVISKFKLKNYILLKRTPHRSLAKKYTPTELENLFHLYLRDVIHQRNSFLFDTPADAKNYDDELRGALKNLKAHLTSDAEVKKSSTFEL